VGRQAGLANWGLVSTPSPYERHVELPSVFNLRDLGGYTGADGRSVAWRRIFRADGLQRLARADLGRLRELGLRTVVDLRRPDEVELGRLEADGVAYHHHSLQPIDWLVDGYDESVGCKEWWW
jgi:protein tyrosine/serine phosphatase